MQSIDVAHCYRRSGVVCLCVCPLVAIVSSAKTDGPIDIPCGLQTLFGSKKLFIRWECTLEPPGK